MNSKLLIITKDEHNLLKGLIPTIIKNTEKKIKEEKNSINNKALKVSVNILQNFNDKLKTIKF